MEWIKFDYDDGAEVYYRLNLKDETVELKTVQVFGDIKETTLFFDEIEEVFEKIKEVKKHSIK